MTVKLLTKQHLEFQSLTGGCRDSSEFTLVKMPHCWKARVTAKIMFNVFWSGAQKRNPSMWSTVSLLLSSPMMQNSIRFFLHPSQLLQIFILNNRQLNFSQTGKIHCQVTKCKLNEKFVSHLQSMFNVSIFDLRLSINIEFSKRCHMW